MNYRVFWLDRTDRVHVSLRVYESGAGRPCGATDPHSYCHVPSVFIDADAPRATWLEDLPDGTHREREELVSADDPRWPAACETCGTPFTEQATRQVWAEALYRGAPDGLLYTLRNAPVGAMWDCEWLKDHPAFVGPDGISLHVRTPGGDWCVDAQCSNCTRPQGVPVEGEPGTHRFVLTHYCWVRHGDPRTGVIHVDKGGETCAAGAGSIISGGYHGFLHNGELRDA